MNSLKILSTSKITRKSADCKILAKYIGHDNWSVYIFKNITNGNKFVEELEVSNNSIYSPCYRKTTKVYESNKQEMNDLYLKLQKEQNYKFMGNYVVDICGGYFNC